MKQASLDLFGVPDSVQVDTKSRLITVFFGSLGIALPQLSDTPDPLPAMKIEAELVNGSWSGVATMFAKGASSSAPLPRADSRHEASGLRNAANVTQLQPRPAPSAPSGASGGSFSGLSRGKPVAQHSPAPRSAPASALNVAPSDRPKFDHSNVDLSDDIPF